MGENWQHPSVGVQVVCSDMATEPSQGCHDPGTGLRPLPDSLGHARGGRFTELGCQSSGWGTLYVAGVWRPCRHSMVMGDCPTWRHDWSRAKLPSSVVVFHRWSWWCW